MTRTPNTRAFTLVELLVALALLAMMLASVAAATHASLQSYSENDQYAGITQTARSIMDRLAREARTCEDISITSTTVSIAPIANAEGLTEIRYERSGNKLLYHRVVNGVTTTHTLLGDSDAVKVTGFSVSRTTAVEGSYTVTKILAAKLTFQADNQTMVVSTSVAPRRNQVY